MSNASFGLDNSDIEESDDDQVFEQIAAGELPQNAETLLALNLTYQELLHAFLNIIRERERKEEEKESALKVEHALALGESFIKEWVRVPVLQYIPPYFRDSCGMATKANEDAIYKQEQGELNPLIEPAKKWSKVEKAKFMQAITNSCIDIETESLKQKRSVLIDQWNRAGPDEHAELSKEIETLNKEIEKKSGKVDITKLDPIFFEKLEWNKISATDMNGTRTPMECRLAFFNSFSPTINQDKDNWSEEELNKLTDLALTHQYSDWDKIAAELGTARTGFQCFERYQCGCNHDILKKEWNESDDDKLREAVEATRVGDYIPWELVTGLMDGRTRAQCQARWTRKLDPSLKSGRWSKEEDESLTLAVRKYGVQKWRKIAKDVTGRTEAQCRERWSSALRGDIKIGGWTKEEDAKLLEGLQIYGTGKWSKVCTMLSGRTPAACKVRHRALTKAKNDGKKREKRQKKEVKKDAAETEEAVDAIDVNLD